MISAIRLIDRTLSIPLMLIVLFWKIFLSPLFPASCRYWPSCSDYAIWVIRSYGASIGLWLCVRRLLRCNALFRGGVDLPPESVTILYYRVEARARFSDI